MRQRNQHPFCKHIYGWHHHRPWSRTWLLRDRPLSNPLASTLVPLLSPRSNSVMYSFIYLFPVCQRLARGIKQSIYRRREHILESRGGKSLGMTEKKRRTRHGNRDRDRDPDPDPVSGRPARCCGDVGDVGDVGDIGDIGDIGDRDRSPASYTRARAAPPPPRLRRSPTMMAPDSDSAAATTARLLFSSEPISP